MRFLLRFLINAAALWVATQIVPGVEHTGPWTSLLLVALVFGVLNAIVRPILKILTCPLIVLTLGLFTIVVNMAVLGITDWLVDGFDIQGFWTYAGTVLVIGAVNTVLGWVLPERVKRR